jgi:glycosyltransferase involved in cell wall biosynthesis
LKDELVFNLTVPAKIQAYMAASKPIIAMLNGEGQEIIKQAQCGYTVNAGDYQALAKLVEEISKIPKESLQLVGRNGFEYYKANFTKQYCIDNLCKLMDGE